MIKIKNEETLTELIGYLNEMRKRQEEIADTNELYYSRIGLYLALKKKILFKNFLLHPKVLYAEPYYKNKSIIKESELEELLKDVIEYELTANEEALTKDERDKIIKIHKTLLKKRESNGTLQTLNSVQNNL